MTMKLYRDSSGQLRIPHGYKLETDKLLKGHLAAKQAAIVRGVREKTGFHGNINFGVWDAETLELISTKSTPNLVVNGGKATLNLMLRFLSPSARKIRYIVVGTGTTAPTATDTDLETQLALKEISNWDDTNNSGASPTVQAQVIFDASEANGEITEVGFEFDDNSLLSRTLIAQGTDISGITNANPGVVTTTGAHGLVDGDRVKLENVGGMTEVNGNYYYIDQLTSTTFALYSDASLTTTVNTTGFGTYTSGGKWTQSKLKTSSQVVTVTYDFGNT